MSNHKYTQYSNYTNNSTVEPTVEEQAVVVETETITPVVEGVIETPAVEVETVSVPDPVELVEGVIANCAKLNVRVAPNATADVLCVLNVASEIEIDLAKSTDEWYRVCTATGIEGYCMRKFVDVCL